MEQERRCKECNNVSKEKVCTAMRGRNRSGRQYSYCKFPNNFCQFVRFIHVPYHKVTSVGQLVNTAFRKQNSLALVLKRSLVPFFTIQFFTFFIIVHVSPHIRVYRSSLPPSSSTFLIGPSTSTFNLPFR